MAEHPVFQVAQFMKLGGQTVPEDVDLGINPKEIAKFIDRVDEEVEETFDAADINSAYEGTQYEVNHAEVLDGFIDAAYAALTGAIRVAGLTKARVAWDLVVDANLSKVDGRFGPPIINPETGKIGKPEGWKSPDIEAVIRG